jgi:hypothetical protein
MTLTDNWIVYALEFFLSFFSNVCHKNFFQQADSSEMIKAGMTNLGLRTAGDGQVNEEFFNLESKTMPKNTFIPLYIHYK